MSDAWYLLLAGLVILSLWFLAPRAMDRVLRQWHEHEARRRLRELRINGPQERHTCCQLARLVKSFSQSPP